MLEIQPCICMDPILFAILEFVIRFVSNCCNWCPVSLRTIQWKNEVSILINGKVTANYRLSQPPFFSSSWNLQSDLCQTSRNDVRCHYAQFSEKRIRPINKWLIIVFHDRRFVRYLGIFNPICVKLLQVMAGVIPRNLKKNDISISNRFSGVHKRGIHTQTHTHTHTWR